MCRNRPYENFASMRPKHDDKCKANDVHDKAISCDPLVCCGRCSATWVWCGQVPYFLVKCGPTWSDFPLLDPVPSGLSPMRSISIRPLLFSRRSCRGWLKYAGTPGQTPRQWSGHASDDGRGDRQTPGRTPGQTSSVVISEKPRDVVTHARTDLRRRDRLKERCRV